MFKFFSSFVYYSALKLIKLVYLHDMAALKLMSLALKLDYLWHARRGENMTLKASTVNLYW